MRSLLDELSILELELGKVISATLHEAGEVGVRAARETNLFHHGNAFEQQIQFTPQTATAGEVVSGAPYSQYLEYGNGSGDIYPVTANALHFNVNGQEVFAKHVRSHGPLPFMEQAADHVEEQLPEIFATNFDKLIK